MELLQSCRDYAHKFYGDLLMVAEKTLNDSLFKLAEQSNSNEEQRLYYESMQQLKARSGAMHASFSQEMGKSFQIFVAGNEQEKPLEEDIAPSGLSLVQREELEDELAISVIISKSNSRYSEGLWKLNRRLAVLRGGKSVSDESNPFGPGRVCEALQIAVQQLELGSKAKIQVYKQLGKIFILSFGKAIDKINGQMVDKGILPNLRFSVSKEAGPSAIAEPMEGAAPVDAQVNAEEDLFSIAGQQQMLQAIRSLQQHTGPRTHTAGGISLGGIPANLISYQPQSPLPIVLYMHTV